LDQYVAPNIVTVDAGLKTNSSKRRKHCSPRGDTITSPDSVSSYFGRRSPLTIRANLSKYHPDAGMTPKEHEESKALRAKGKKKFIPKEEIKKKAYRKR